MNSDQIKRIENDYVAGTYGRFDLAIVKGKGSRCEDAEGNEYIDFTSGIGVNCLGYSDSGWASAISDQAGKLQHVSNLYYTEPCSLLAERMIKLTGMSKMFFSNSGAESNEGAIKAARKYSKIKYGQNLSESDYNRYEILTLNESFHGRTMATVTATGQESFHKDFVPFLQGFGYVKANDIEDLNAKVTEKTCAIMIEFIQGEGGVNDISQQFVDEITRICHEKDILFIADEVQTGIGRTGKFMAYQHYGVIPDIVTVAKGIGGGLPLGGILFNSKTDNVLQKGDHGSTFGGNPVVCAGANYILSKMDEAFLLEVERKGTLIREKLLEIDEVKSISGKGLMIGFSLKTKNNAEVANECLKNGLLVLTAKDKIRLLPPLNINDEDITSGLNILEKTLLSF